ncbi:MAG: hypothetical protein LBE79_05760 [Tannerella sp.]|jgi:hypothetical protein|nr:hypothetical protein [Tannerella sp.]
MTSEQLIEECLKTCGHDFAKTRAERVVSTQSLPVLWGLIENCKQLNLPKADLEKLEFRSAYILEAVYLKDSQSFTPFLPRFFEIFPSVTNGSMRRHFSKICFFAIKKGYSPPNVEAIATACADWIIDLHTRVAVKVWALDILFEFSKTEKWLKELLPEIIESISKNPSQGMLVRLRRIKNNLSVP